MHYLRKFWPVIVIVFGFLFFYYWKNPLRPKVRINNHIFYVDVAVTPKQRERGLSGRKKLENNEGMLFLFEDPGLFHFWMREMLFPLDFIWIDGNTIVDLSKNVPHPTGNESAIELAPKEPVDKVLEINAGTIDAIGATIGDTIEFLSR